MERHTIRSDRSLAMPISHWKQSVDPVQLTVITQVVNNLTRRDDGVALIPRYRQWLRSRETEEIPT